MEEILDRPLLADCSPLYPPPTGLPASVYWLQSWAATAASIPQKRAQRLTQDLYWIVDMTQLLISAK